MSKQKSWFGSDSQPYFIIGSVDVYAAKTGLRRQEQPLVSVAQHRRDIAHGRPVLRDILDA